MDAWKLAELKGMLYCLLLKVDTMAEEGSDMETVQGYLEQALEYMEEISA